MSKRRAKFSAPLTVFLCIVCLVMGTVVGFIGMGAYNAATFKSDKAVVGGALEIHFPE